MRNGERFDKQSTAFAPAWPNNEWGQVAKVKATAAENRLNAIKMQLNAAITELKAAETQLTAVESKLKNVQSKLLAVETDLEDPNVSHSDITHVQAARPRSDPIQTGHQMLPQKRGALPLEKWVI